MNLVPIQTLETERLLLRPVCLADADRIQQLLPHWEVVKYMGTAIPWPYPENGAREWLDRTVDNTQEYCWAITLKDAPDEGLVGVIGLYPTAENNRGFWLGQEYWGRGLMKEATTGVNDFAFNVLGMESLRLDNAEPNLASHRLKESVGAEVLSVEEGYDFVGGKFPIVRWVLTAERWREHRSAQNARELPFQAGAHERR